MSTARIWVLTLAGLLVVAVVLGLRGSPPRTGTDAALGPDSGAAVEAYLQDARTSLDGVADTRWALLSPSAELTAAAAARIAAGTRVSQVLLRVSLERVQTPLLAVQVADQGGVLADELAAAQRLAGGQLLSGPSSPGRAGRVAQVSGERLRAGCACVVGLVLRGSGPALRAVAARSGVRAVQVAPGGTDYGRLSVVPLLPDQTTTITPGADDGAVPAG